MKIALVVPGGVDRGGVERVIPRLLWLIERLAIRHEIHVFATRQQPRPGEWKLLGAHVHNIGIARGTTVRLLARFAAEHRRAPFDVVHAFFGVCGTYAAVIGWRFRLPVLFHPSGGEFVAISDADYGMRRTALGRVAMSMAIAGADRVTVASQPMQALAAARGVSAELVALGVALDRWPAVSPRPRDISRPPRLLHVGDLRPVKDQQMLMTAIAELHTRGIAFELDVVGLGTASEELSRTSAGKLITGSARYHGVLRREELRVLFARADLLLVSSRHEAGPLVVLEAAVAGVPTVGTAVGHIAEWAPRAAVAVPVGDAPSFAREIAALINDEPRRMAMAVDAQRRAVAIDADYTAARFESIYREMAAAR